MNTRRSFSFLSTMALLLVCLQCSPSSSAIQAPPDCGQHLFALLQQVNQSSMAEFESQFLSLKEVKALAKNEKMDLTPEVREAFSTVEEEEYVRDRRFLYQALKRSHLATDAPSDWSQINMKDFTFKEENRDGLTYLDGTLTIEAEGKTYQSPCIYLLIESGYRLVGFQFPGLVE